MTCRRSWHGSWRLGKALPNRPDPGGTRAPSPPPLRLERVLIPLPQFWGRGWGGGQKPNSNLGGGARVGAEIAREYDAIIRVQAQILVGYSS